ncbi:hypothetical protein HY933_04290 [Candidatus Falkowbacteria bacterium]|nr:hypothetical protein [Candidatus Falkowbacteria bacterium]
MTRAKKVSIFFFSLALVMLFLPNVVAAAEPNPDTAKPQMEYCTEKTWEKWYKDIQERGQGRGLFEGTSPVCWACGDCNVCDFLGIANGIVLLILGIMGGVAFLFFLYGGISFIIAAGNAERITQAKSILTNAIIGIIIILLAWEIVNIVIGALAGQPIGEAANIFSGGKDKTPWYQVCNDQVQKSQNNR